MPRSVMQHEFSRVPRGDVPRSSFNLSCGHKTTFDAGKLVPVHWDYVYPGDVFRIQTFAYVRLSSPLEFPLMDNARLTVHWYQAPLRILWDNYRKFFGEQIDPDDSIDFTVPAISSGTTVNMQQASGFQQIADYMGLPHVASMDLSEISAFPFRAYNKVWNYWYRDQNLQDSMVENQDDGPDNITSNDATSDYFLANRGKRHDYFTSCLPKPQKGDAVSIPLGTSADIATAASAGGAIGIYSASTADHHLLDSDLATVDVSATVGSTAETNRMFADLTNATASTINQLREAFAIQQFLERDMRGGTRFGEQILSHYGVQFQDVRYAPEFLGGGSVPIIVSPISNQSATTGNVGDLAAIGTASMSGAGFTKAFDEPSVLLGLACVDADLTYQHGLDRKWSYSTRYDFYWPEFAHLGEQTVLNQEIFYQNTAADNSVFGYQERYAELRHGMSRISKEFRSDNALTLDSWHLSEDEASLPTLGADWIESNPPFDRVMAVSTQNHFIADFYFDIRAARPLPTFGVPGLRRL